MNNRIIKFAPALLLIILAPLSARAGDHVFSRRLYPKFQTRACTVCHDFYERTRNGLAFSSHRKRLDPNRCPKCHNAGVTGFKHPEEWFAMPGLYTSGMSPRQTCKKIKEALHARFKSDRLIAAQVERHLFTDPRVLWGIEGATEKSGRLPFKKREKDLVKGGLDEWGKEVRMWTAGGLECE